MDLFHKFTQKLHLRRKLLIFPSALITRSDRCDLSTALWLSAALMRHFPSLAANHSMIPPPTPRSGSTISIPIRSVSVRAAARGNVALVPGIAGGLNPGSWETEIDTSTAPHSLLSNWLATLLHFDISLLFLRSGFLAVLPFVLQCDEEHHGRKNCEGKCRSVWFNFYRPSQTQVQRERNNRSLKGQEVALQWQEDEFTKM